MIAPDYARNMRLIGHSDQGGRPVCVVVVLVPGKDGKRPRRVEFVVPAN